MKLRLGAKIIYLVAFLILILTGIAQSDIISVPADRTTIQMGILAASDGDTVLVAPGIYSGSGNSQITFLGKRILVTSENGPEQTTILTTGLSRSIVFDNEEDSLSILDGFTISGGYEIDFNWYKPYQGGIYCLDASPIIRNCVIRDCYAEEGGGMFSSGGMPRIENCIFDNNKASHRGGAIISLFNQLTISNTAITNNWVNTVNQEFLASGGGIKNLGNLILKNCNISGNRVTHHSQLPALNNFALAQGGGIYSLSGNIEIDSCIIARNSAGTGGGLLCGLADASVSYSKIYNNSSSVYSGIVFISGFQNPFNVQNSTFACNYSARDLSDGVAILSAPSFVQDGKNAEGKLETGNYSSGGIIKNNLFAFNSSTPIYSDDLNYPIEVSYNNIWHTVSGQNYGGVFSDLTGVDGNISLDPLLCSVSDSGLDIDASSPCADGGESGGIIGAGQVNCDLYISPPQKTSISLIEVFPADNQALLDNAINQLRPWDTLQITSDNSTVLIEHLSIDFPIYIFGSGKYRDSSFVITKEFSLQNRSTISINDFSVINNLWISGYDGDGTLLGYNAVSISNASPIIDSSFLTAFETDASIATFDASPLIRISEATNGISAIGNRDVVASKNYWGCHDIICISDLLQFDTLFYNGTIFIEPFLTKSPTSIENGTVLSLPNRIVLYQNYPNPFNASTTIKFSIPRIGHTKLSIYNILGHRVAILLDKQLPTGSHQVIWNGKDDSCNDSPSGMYFYNLKTNNQSDTKFLMLLK